MSLDSIIESKKLDRNNLRLSIGGGDREYSNAIIFELTKERDNKVDVLGDIREGLPFEDETFKEVLMIHVIEHIERKYHRNVFDEVWRVLSKDNGRLILSFPDFIEAAKGFIANSHGGRWETWNMIIYGRQDGEGDYHVTAMETQDITDKLLNSGFVNIKTLRQGVNTTMSAYKGDKLTEFI